MHQIRFLPLRWTGCLTLQGHVNIVNYKRKHQVSLQSIHLVEGSDPTSTGDAGSDAIQMTTNSLYVFLHTQHGVDIKWDRGTSIYVTLDPIWMGRVCGLCGNFDLQTDNDLLSRSGVVEENPIVFGKISLQFILL